MGTQNLLEVAKKHKIEKFFQISTDEVYGSLGKTGFFTEKTPLSPNSPYSASKASADLLVMAYHHTLCPILAIISYIFFENNKIKKKDIPYTMIFTITYTIILIICNILHIIEGPYPFLLIYKQPVYMSILWILIIDGGAYLLSKGLYIAKK